MTDYNYLTCWDDYNDQGFTDNDFINFFEENHSDNEVIVSLISRWNSLLASMPDASYASVLYYGPDTDDGEPNRAMLIWFIQQGLTNEWRHYHRVARINRDACSDVIDLTYNLNRESWIVAATEEQVDSITLDDVIKSVDSYLTLHNH